MQNKVEIVMIICQKYKVTSRLGVRIRCQMFIHFWTACVFAWFAMNAAQGPYFHWRVPRTPMEAQWKRVQAEWKFGCSGALSAAQSVFWMGVLESACQLCVFHMWKVIIAEGSIRQLSTTALLNQNMLSLRCTCNDRKLWLTHLRPCLFSHWKRSHKWQQCSATVLTTEEIEFF